MLFNFDQLQSGRGQIMELESDIICLFTLPCVCSVLTKNSYHTIFGEVLSLKAFSKFCKKFPQKCLNSERNWGRWLFFLGGVHFLGVGGTKGQMTGQTDRRRHEQTGGVICRLSTYHLSPVSEVHPCSMIKIIPRTKNHQNQKS